MFTSLAGFALAGLLLTNANPATPGKKAYVPYEDWTRDLVETGKGDPLATTDVKVKIGGRTLHFSPTADGSNIETRFDPAIDASSLKIDLKDPTKKVRRIVAVARNTFAALAVERGIPESTSFDYVMVFGRRGQVDDNSMTWCVSRPQLTATYEKRCNVMHVELPDGDTIAMTLQQLLRDSNGNYKDIDSHSFVNACPFPDKDGFMMDSITNQYSGTLTRESEKPAAK